MALSKILSKAIKKVKKKKPIAKTIKQKAKPKTSSDYVKVPEKYYRDEDKYEKMMMAGKKLSDVQLKAYSKAIKFTIDNMAEIDGRQYVTRKAKDTIKGTVSHALREMDFLPKEYLDLYKKRKK